MQFFVSHLHRWLRCRFSQPQYFAISYLFADLHLFSSDSFSSLIFFLLLFSSLLFSSLLLSSLLFSSLILPTSGFPSVHIVGSLTSKLPSILMNSDDFIKIDYDFAQIWTFAGNLCFLARNSPSFSRTPTKSAKGCCRKWLSNETWSKFHVVRVAGGHT